MVTAIATTVTDNDKQWKQSMTACNLLIKQSQWMLPSLEVRIAAEVLSFQEGFPDKEPDKVNVMYM